MLREHKISAFKKVRHGLMIFKQNANKFDFILKSVYIETSDQNFTL